MTYLQLVNAALARLRESSVATISQTAYASLIGAYINDAKRYVEDAWNWDALAATITVTTVPGTTTYTVTGSGRRQKDVTVNDTSNQARLNNVPMRWITDQQQLSIVQAGAPTYYAWNGTDGTDSKVEIYPTPDGAYTLKFNMVVPQVELVNEADVLIVPSEAVVAGAVARALAERGEDGGLASSEAFGLYKSILSDQIAIESARYVENDSWVAN
jgi:hypothetical protein